LSDDELHGVSPGTVGDAARVGTCRAQILVTRKILG
jgi:hypothetical protein